MRICKLGIWSGIAAAALLCGCSVRPDRRAAILTGGDATRGPAAIARYGCGSCHTIPGISGAHGLVGPSLSGIASRVYVAGALTNNPSNLERWIQNAPAINEHTVMPNLGVTKADVIDIAAYLYSGK